MNHGDALSPLLLKHDLYSSFLFRNTENLYLVIGVAFTSESLSQTDVLTVLYNAVLTGIDKSAIRVESKTSL